MMIPMPKRWSFPLLTGRGNSHLTRENYWELQTAGDAF
jgi:hypothetical protein